MRKDLQLRTFGTLELWPAATLRARGNAQARQVSLARGVIRAAGHGDYLATIDDRNADPPVRPLRRLRASEQVELRRWRSARTRPLRCQPRPGHPDHARRALGIPKQATGAQPAHQQPDTLGLAGWDRYGRPLWLLPAAARAWFQLQRAATRSGISLDAISGFRSYAHQTLIFRRKLQRGQTLEQILRVNTAPGFSEHHSGCALDIGSPGEPPADTTFEHTAAFVWLCANASRFGFVLSYPRNNGLGIDYEPWHWCWHRRPLQLGTEGFPR
ncbi:MAG: D-alanyl-D-alanine carboxypeptidase family protein [Lysobacteraceae bacterium]